MVELRTATPDDIPAIIALRADEGMRAYRWALLEAMRPPHARFVLGVDDGRPMAMGSGISYGALGVVGNMVVADAYRRRGIGRAILERVLSFLTDERSCTVLELSATTMGRPLYEQYGFEPAGGNAMVTIPRSAATGATDGVEAAGAAALDEIAAYDAARFGGDRSPLLAAALADAKRPMLLARRDGAIAGYGVVRLEAGRLGPWLAEDRNAAGELLAAAARVTPGAGPLSTNIGLENEAGVAWFRQIGSEVDTWEGRMRRGDPATIQRRPETIFGNVVGALG